jgi:hypothetical protein
MAENTNIEKTFTYDIADQYLYQTNKLKRKAEWTYKGPDKLWIFIDSSTNKISSRFHYTERDEGADVPTPDGQIKVLVDATVNPDIASLIHNEWDYGSLPHTTEELPNGAVYGHPDPIPPDHTYELTEITYDTKKSKFVKPYPWKQPHVSWDDISDQRNNCLSWSDLQYVQAPENKKIEWEEFRQTLRDLPTVFKDIDPWKVPFPHHPGSEPPVFRVGEPTTGST